MGVIKATEKHLIIIPKALPTFINQLFTRTFVSGGRSSFRSHSQRSLGLDQGLHSARPLRLNITPAPPCKRIVQCCNAGTCCTDQRHSAPIHRIQPRAQDSPNLLRPGPAAPVNPVQSSLSPRRCICICTPPSHLPAFLLPLPSPVPSLSDTRGPFGRHCSQSRWSRTKNSLDGN